MWCNCAECENNTDSQCDITDYVIIQKDGTCDSMHIVEKEKNDDINDR